jgi:hypothetical protein
MNRSSSHPLPILQRLAPAAKRICLTIAVCIFPVLLLASGCTKQTPPEPEPVIPDTTSGEFVWETIYVGDGNSSMLHDVSIVDDSTAFFVGEFYFKDSLGQVDGAHPMNLVVWKGQSWTAKMVSYYPGLYTQLYGAFAVDENNVWLAGNGLLHWTSRWTEPVSGVLQFWGGCFRVS